MCPFSIIKYVHNNYGFKNCLASLCRASGLINSKEWSFFRRKVRCVYKIHHAVLPLSFPCAGTSALYHTVATCSMESLLNLVGGKDLAAFKLPPEKNNRGLLNHCAVINSSVSLYLLFCEDIPSAFISSFSQ